MTFHFIQREILGKLMFNPKLKFSELQLDEITSKHFNYHLQKLVEEGFILKDTGYYLLSEKGKGYVGKIDDVRLKIEKQPKVSVGILVRRFEKGKEEFLLSRRLKQPYFGKVGGFTGKVRFGETFEDTARRELLEEAGIDGDFKMSGIVRKMAYKEEGNEKTFVQDQVMVLFLVENIKGDVILRSKESENFWLAYEKIAKRKDLYNTFLHFLEISRSKAMRNIEYFAEAEGF